MLMQKILASWIQKENLPYEIKESKDGGVLIVIDKKEAVEKFQRAGKELILLNIGESYNFIKK